MRQRIFSFALVIGVLLATAAPAEAQRVPGALGIGGQVGDPSGVTIKIYNPGGMSYDLLGAWDLDDFFFLNLHGQYERSLGVENVSGIEYFFGPGAFVGIRDRGEPVEDDFVLGISGRFGINIPLEDRFEFYAQVTPRISLVPDTDGDVGGGVGIRYYF